jgi:hypothetical protein
MPVDAIHDLLTDRPRAVDSPFELAARRIMANWLETSCVAATADDLRLATDFLKRVGVTIEHLPGCEVRLVSERGQDAIMSREAAVMTAIRHLVALDAQRMPRPIARAA